MSPLKSIENKFSINAPNSPKAPSRGSVKMGLKISSILVDGECESNITNIWIVNTMLLFTYGDVKHQRNICARFHNHSV